MATDRETLLVLLIMLLAWQCVAYDTCYAGRLNLQTDLPACLGNERAFSVRNATFHCKGNPIQCFFEMETSCSYVYEKIRTSIPSVLPTPTGTPGPVPSGTPTSTSVSIPMSSATPTCTAVLRNLTAYCRNDCCARLTCPPLLRDDQGFVRNLTDHQIVRFGFINDELSTYNQSLDGFSGEIYRPRCQCEVKGNFLYKDYCITSIGSFPRNRPFLRCSVCYECFETPFEASLAASSSSYTTIDVLGETKYCPQRDGTDPVGCFAGSELDPICLDNFRRGLDVNGDSLFCSENPCNPRSLCNCSYVDFHEQCTDGAGEKVFKTILPVMVRDPVRISTMPSDSELQLPQVSFDGENLLVDSRGPFNIRLIKSGTSFNLKSQGTALYNLRKMIPPGHFSINTNRGDTVHNFYLSVEKTNNHRALGIAMFSLSLAFTTILVLIGLWKCTPKLTACIRNTPAYSKIRSGGSAVIDQFLPTKLNIVAARSLIFFAGVGMVLCSVSITEDSLIVKSNERIVIINDCNTARQYSLESFLVLSRPNVDCLLSVSHYNGTAIVLEENIRLNSWTDCRLREDFLGNLTDAVSCSSSTTDLLLAVSIILSLVLICVLFPTFVKVSLIFMALLLPVKACDFSQSLTSSSVNCVNTPNGQNCSLTGTFSAELRLSQEFCVTAKNGFGVPSSPLVITYSNSTEILQVKISGYTQAFDQTYFSKDRCNDCLFSCNGDCSSDQCQLIGGFGVNPNGQNTDNSVLSCPSYAGCDLIEDDVAQSWTSGCLLKPNCHWWQYISCGRGEISPISEIFASRVSSDLLVTRGNSSKVIRTTDKQPVSFDGFLISTSTQVNPVDYSSLGYDTLVRKNGDSYLCDTQGFLSSRKNELGDYFCSEPSCTYAGPSTIRIPADLCTHDTLGADSVFACSTSFYDNLETQSSCRKLPFTNEAGLVYIKGSSLLIDLSESSQIEVRVSALNSSFEFTSDLVRPDLKVGNCSGYVNYTGSSSCVLKGKCTPHGLVSLATDSSSVILSDSSVYCSEGATVRFSVFEEDVDFDLVVGNFIYNQTMRIKFTAENYTAVIQSAPEVRKVEDSGWEPFDSWDKVLKGLGNFWDWLIIVVECILALCLLFIFIYAFFRILMCLAPLILGKLSKMRKKRTQDKKDSLPLTSSDTVDITELRKSRPQKHYI